MISNGSMMCNHTQMDRRVCSTVSPDTDLRLVLVEGFSLVQGNENFHQKLLVLRFQGKSKTIDDAGGRGGRREGGGRRGGGREVGGGGMEGEIWPLRCRKLTGSE